MLFVPDYVVPNPATRVRKLLANIRSNNSALLASITSVQTSTTLINYLLANSRYSSIRDKSNQNKDNLKTKGFCSDRRTKR